KKIFVVEDASHALGSKYDGTPVGSCEFSDMVVFSFHPVKHITTGEGGAVCTQNRGLFGSLQMHRSHGITRTSEYLEDPAPSPWHYQQVTLGYNYRITDVQSALGVSQLKKLPRFSSRRKELIS